MDERLIEKGVGESLRSQYLAALATLAQTVESCDPGTWVAAHPDGEINQAVFHTLMFTDLYLDWGEELFRAQPFHREHPELFQDYEELRPVMPSNRYPQEGCAEYLGHCRKKVEAALAGESGAILLGECGYPRRKMSRLELHIYNIRHIQHHAAQLGLRRQLAGGDELDWVSRGG